MFGKYIFVREQFYIRNICALFIQTRCTEVDCTIFSSEYMFLISTVPDIQYLRFFSDYFIFLKYSFQQAIPLLAKDLRFRFSLEQDYYLVFNLVVFQIFANSTLVINPLIYAFARDDLRTTARNLFNRKSTGLSNIAKCTTLVVDIVTLPETTGTLCRLLPMLCSRSLSVTRGHPRSNWATESPMKLPSIIIPVQAIRFYL